MTKSLAAIQKLESITVRASGVTGTVLRYGSLYGPGAAISPDGEIVKLVHERKLPVIGDGAGIWSFIHVDDAAGATRLAIENDAPGIYNIVDDEPAEVSIWLPELAKALGAKPPRHIPAWLGRLMIGEAGVFMMTKARGSSNAKAKRVLGWKPASASWREGLRPSAAVLQCERRLRYANASGGVRLTPFAANNSYSGLCCGSPLFLPAAAHKTDPSRKL